MLKLFLFCVLCSGAYAYNHGQALIDFEAYEAKFNKTYANTAERNNAMYYFNYHRNQIASHNALADRNASSYRVKVNQFSDIRLITFAARLPQAVYPTTLGNSTPVPPNEIAPSQYDMLSELGITVSARDQGTVCSSSWAYAAATSIQILNAVQTLTTLPLNNSAQALIDCAGMGTGCTTQVPQTAFDYLTQTDAVLLNEDEYAANNSWNHQGMCLPKLATSSIKLDSYGTIEDGDDDLLMRYVASQIPVIVEYNPATFGFMHYSSGVYVPPVRATASSSQFLVVVGYGHDTDSNLDYWLCLNSFGAEWGEKGFIKIVRSSVQPIAKRAIFPNSLGASTSTTP
ncbi:uncharacterized protein LOC135427988 [Drosophila montana]|uniref:uncharacterized protein LOC135427988 n=1 Tax=Drosophila montana TaxID=40370 RepID=UPI00313DBAC4